MAAAVTRRHVLRNMLHFLLGFAVPLTLLCWVENRWDIAVLAALANWLVIVVVWNSLELLLSGLKPPKTDVKVSKLYMLYAILSIAALASTAIFGVESVWAVYGVGMSMGVIGVLGGRWTLSTISIEVIPYLAIAYAIAAIWFTPPMTQLLPLALCLVAAYNAARRHGLDVLVVLGLTAYYVALLAVGGAQLAVPVASTSVYSYSVLPWVVAIFIFYLIVGICEEMSSRALWWHVGIATAVVFVLLHIPSRFYGLLVPSIQQDAGIADVASMLTLYISAMLYLVVPTALLTMVAVKHGLLSAILFHAAFDTMVSIPVELSIAILLGLGALYTLYTKRR